MSAQQRMSPGQLAAEFLGGREAAWISKKQAQWLRNVLSQTRECKGFGSHRDPYSFNGQDTTYTLYISPLNGAGMLRNEGAQYARQVAAEQTKKNAEHAEIRSDIVRLRDRAAELRAQGQDTTVIEETIDFLAASVAQG